MVAESSGAAQGSGDGHDLAGQLPHPVGVAGAGGVGVGAVGMAGADGGRERDRQRGAVAGETADPGVYRALRIGAGAGCAIADYPGYWHEANLTSRVAHPLIAATTGRDIPQPVAGERGRQRTGSTHVLAAGTSGTAGGREPVVGPVGRA
ncbi:hypothetical protein [Streptomyces sp. NPDC102264]|uniref:hypothetical protein n=1 Tax=Streptomyces sp. NPDC102264 TaxID=3366149 RepID=UPI0038232F5C